MTRLGENMEKQNRLLSSKLFQERKQVEVVINRSVFAWKEIKKEENRSSGISSLSQTGMSRGRKRLLPLFECLFHV